MLIVRSSQPKICLNSRRNHVKLFQKYLSPTHHYPDNPDKSY